VAGVGVGARKGENETGCGLGAAFAKARPSAAQTARNGTRRRYAPFLPLAKRTRQSGPRAVRLLRACFKHPGGAGPSRARARPSRAAHEEASVGAPRQRRVEDFDGVVRRAAAGGGAGADDPGVAQRAVVHAVLVRVVLAQQLLVHLFGLFGSNVRIVRIECSDSKPKCRKGARRVLQAGRVKGEPRSAPPAPCLPALHRPRKRTAVNLHASTHRRTPSKDSWMCRAATGPRRLLASSPRAAQQAPAQPRPGPGPAPARPRPGPGRAPARPRPGPGRPAAPW
jgi:hypothetical protein